MPDERVQAENSAAATIPMPKRALDWARHAWRPAGTVVAVGLALLLTWHVVNGKHGLSVWQQKQPPGPVVRSTGPCASGDRLAPRWP